MDVIKFKDVIVIEIKDKLYDKDGNEIKLYPIEPEIMMDLLD